MSLLSMRRKMASQKTINIVLWVLIIGFLIGIVLLAVPPSMRRGDGTTTVADSRVIATVGNLKITAGEYAEAFAKDAEAAALPPDVTNMLDMRATSFDSLVDKKKEEQLLKKMAVRVSTGAVRDTAKRLANVMVIDARVRSEFQYERELEALVKDPEAKSEDKAAVKKPDETKQAQLSAFMMQSGGKPGKKLTDNAFIAWFTKDYAKKSKDSKVYDSFKKYAEQQLVGEKAIKDLPVSPLSDDYAKGLFTKEVKGSMIFIAATSETKAGLDAAKKKATDLRKTLVENPTNFAAKARAVSDDPVSKENGGDLGWVQGNTGVGGNNMPPVIEYLLYTTKAQELSPVTFVSMMDPRTYTPIMGYVFVKVDEARERKDIPKALRWDSVKEKFVIRTETMYRSAFASNYLRAKAFELPIVRKTEELLAYEARAMNDEATFHKYAKEVVTTAKESYEPSVRAAFAYALAQRVSTPQEKAQFLQEALAYGGREVGRIYIDLGIAYLAMKKNDEARDMFLYAKDTTDLGDNPAIAKELRGYFEQLGDKEEVEELNALIGDRNPLLLEKMKAEQTTAQ